jgi:hypothetical protein
MSNREESERPNNASLEALRETEELIASGHPGYESLEAMFASMDLDSQKPEPCTVSIIR